VSQATAEPDRFLDFLLDPSIEHGEERATRDYGIGLGWIHFLANFGMVGILRRLLDNLRIDIDKSDVRGRTPLYFATICGNCPMVEFLLQKGAQASFGRDETGYTCLHLVTSFRRIDIPRMVQGLVKAGADIDASDKRGATPLHTALMQTGSRTSNFCATQALLENGADPCIKDNDGEMPYYWAVVLHQPEALKLLLKTCIERLSESDMITLKVNLFEHLTLVPRVDIVSFAGSGFPQSLDKIVQLLLDRPTLEAYKNHPDNGGDSALFRASGRGKLELMRSMCRCCPFVDVNEGEIEYNRPAIQYAIRHNKPAVVETLFSLGANIFYRDSLGENALHVAASYAPELVDLILELSKTRGVLEEMIASISVDGLTPLDKSIMAENLDTAQKLIDAGANWEQFRCVNQKEGKTTTLGQILSMPSPSLEQVTFLLLRNASCVVTENGSTAFHALATRSQDIRDDSVSLSPQIVNETS
jgi:ankyrin repeat protein